MGTGLVPARELEPWRTALLEARHARGMTRAQLAQAAGVSVEAVRGYEDGRRRPKLDALEALLAALEPARTDANAIREGAGFAPKVTLGADVGSYYYSAAELERCVELVDWPHFVTNTRFEIIAANGYTRRLWGVDDVPVQHIDGEPRGRNIIVLGLELGFASRIANWNELMLALAAQIKGRPEERTHFDEAQEYLGELLPSLQAADEEVRQGMLRAWTEAQPVPPKIRWTYEVHWAGLDGSRRNFKCFATLANDVEGLEFHDWIPCDDESWCAIAPASGAT